MAIFHSDDYGLSRKVDIKLLSLIAHEKLQGISILSTTIGQGSIQDLNRTLQSKKIACSLSLHFNLIEDSPLSSPNAIRSLVNSDGALYPLPLFFLHLILGKIETSEIKKELQAQLARLDDAGLQMHMIDSHQHTHALSPVAELVVDEAKKRGLQVRSFRMIRTFTAIGLLKYSVLKLMAFLSHWVAYGRVGLPSTWQIKEEMQNTVMSWEGQGFDVKNYMKDNIRFVIHPFLPYDTNRSYEKVLTK